MSSFTLLWTAHGVVVVVVVVNTGEFNSDSFSVVNTEMYSQSLIAKLPLTPSKCLTSTVSATSLQNSRLSLVISVINLSGVSRLPLAHNIIFLILSNIKGNCETEVVSAK